jgi:benzoyl-CoA-dihydrodiol lyase
MDDDPSLKSSVETLQLAQNAIPLIIDIRTDDALAAVPKHALRRRLAEETNVDAVATNAIPETLKAVDFQTDPSRYKHWKMSFDGPVATLTMDVNEEGGLRPGYKLKLNSYDLGVDIELHDALQRIRFEHPEVRTVVLASAKSRIFCSGANIYMLGLSSHAWKVNFCKFTNETRNGIEDASAYSGLKFLAALNGTTAGGGYELALACDEIVLVDDRSSAVSLPEVPLLGVLPGTGGLTRLTDKRKVRRDHADIFCTTPDGIRGLRAKDWRLVDEAVKTQQFAEHIKKRAQELAALSDRPANAKGVALSPLQRNFDDAGLHYEFVDAQFNRESRTVTITVRGPEIVAKSTIDQVVAAGASWWPLQMARELDDAILNLRSNEPDLGLWILKTTGNREAVFAIDEFIFGHQDNWFVREVLGMMRRTFARLDVSSRSMFALVEPGSCFAGTLFELALAADRVYMLDTQEEGAAAEMTLTQMNFGALPMVNHLSRITARFYGDEMRIDGLRGSIGQNLSAREAMEAGLVTAAPDDLDWQDEVRLAIESRVALSPDALTGLEASLRFGAGETMETRIFGRLSAWQNWIFIRPNAVGASGALKVYGTGAPVKFNWERV